MGSGVSAVRSHAMRRDCAFRGLRPQCRMTMVRSLLPVIALLPLLSGCIGVAAVPVIAGGAVVRHHSSGRAHTARAKSRADHTSPAPDHTPQVALTNLTELPPPSGTPAPALSRLAQLSSPSGPPAVAPTGLAELPPPSGASASAAVPDATPQVTLTHLTELPRPSGSPVGSPPLANPWQPLVDYALAQARLTRSAEPPQSALLLPLQRGRRPCTAPYPAVIIDLDQAHKTFAPDQATGPAPGLSGGLARLRESGVRILWITQLPASRAADVARALRSSGLDPEGKDRLLLIRGRDDRKQLEREHANESSCVVALAGDQRSDFDELFDYLRDPTSTAGLDEMLGNGWFLVPQPLTAPAP